MIEPRIHPFLIDENVSIVQAMKKIDSNAHGIVFVIDVTGRLAGCLTDGDIRRWIIHFGDLNETVQNVMKRRPLYMVKGTDEDPHEFMRKHIITALPIVNTDLEILDIVFLKDSLYPSKPSTALVNIPIVIMAGGKGTRLYPYTKILPKPLIPIGDVPIMERILNQFYEYGAKDFYLSLNYRKEMIKAYFQEIEHDYQLHYIEEEEALGTAGSLRLIQGVFSDSFMVTNCDILIDVDYEKLLEYHKESGNSMTVVAAMKNTILSYGILHTESNGQISFLEEKPQMSYLINTGMYVMDPNCLSIIPKDGAYDMTELIMQLVHQKFRIGVYPIGEEAFLDMGQIEELKQMEDKLREREQKK